MTTFSFNNLFPDASTAQCNGCGVCMLSCPVWMQHRTPALTSCGRTRAVQDGAPEAELALSARTCILCGSCEALCPRDLRTLQATMRIRSMNARTTNAVKDRKRTGKRSSGRVLLAGQAMQRDPKLLNLVLSLIGTGATSVADDDGRDIVAAIETGAGLSDERIADFISNLSGASEVVLADGLLFSLLEPLLPKTARLRSVSELLLMNPDVRAGIRPTDLYIIETRSYNLRWSTMVTFYDKLRAETGCSMNLDLQRVATPTGSLGMRYRRALPSFVAPEKQIAWLLEGRDPDRVIVEHPDDRVAFELHASLSVVHLAEVVRS